MQVVILHESLTGHTEQAARLIANAFYEHQIAARVFPVDGYDAEALAAADLVVAGSWTDGFFVIGQKPGRRKKFTHLPDLGGKRAAVFCTFALDPGQTLDKLTKIVADRGAEVIGGLAIRRDRLEEGAADFVGRLLDVASA
jgi:flavodoxin